MAKKINKIIFVGVVPLSGRDYDRFGIDILQENGFEVEFWDLSRALAPEFSGKYVLTDKLSWKGNKRIMDRKAAITMLGGLGDGVLVIINPHYNPKVFQCYKAVSKSRANYACVPSNALPIPRPETGLSAGRLKRMFFSNGGLVEKILYRGFHRVPYNMLGVKPARFILAGGTESLKYNMPRNDATEIVWGHNFDYDRYLSQRGREISGSNTAVFIDQNVPFHPDHAYTKTDILMEAREYFPLLDRFFDRVEKNLKCEVVVALHPRADLDVYKRYLRDRKIIKGRTIELVRDSKAAITHSSTSLTFVNLFKKPAIFITSEKLDRTYKGPFFRLMAGLFGKKPVFMDRADIIDWDAEMNIDTDKYSYYRQAYIKKDGSPEEPFWKIVSNRIKQGV